MSKWYEFSQSRECDEQLAKELIKQGTLILNNQSHFNIALAGGKTPISLYEQLSLTTFSWDKVQVTLTDERWVEAHEADSNEKMLRQSFLKNNAVDASFIPLKNSVQNPSQAVSLCEKSLKDCMPELDAVILGMGEDGHFASIFPNTDNLTSLLNINESALCQAVFPVGKPARMSLTLGYLLTAKKIYLRVSGGVKKQLLLDIFDGHANTENYPVTALINQKMCPVEIYWSA